MDGYTTIACSICKDEAYLDTRRLEASNWYCPSCGAMNESPRVPALAGAVVGGSTSPLAPPPPPMPTSSLPRTTSPVEGASPPSRKRTLSMRKKVAIGVLAVLGIATAASQTLGEKTDAPTKSNVVSAPPVADAPAVAPAPVPEPPAYIPQPSDFVLAVKVLEKQCFGSAGCNITYRIDVSYVGSTLPDPDHEFEVIYEVRGGEDGVITNTFTLTGDQVSIDSEEFTSTKRSKDKLTAVAIEVVT